MKGLSAMLLCDFYKISHRAQYPKGTERVYSTWTPRISRIPEIEEIVVFGLQAFIKKYLIEYFNEHFFQRPKDEVVAEYSRIIKHTLGVKEPETQHIERLHDLGHLPLIINGLPEGTVVPLRTPVMTIENTAHEFFWLTNYVESLASCELWKASTSATIAHAFRTMLDAYAQESGGHSAEVDFQAHDFSFRGMSGLDDAISSGMGHLLSFRGTDSIPAIVGCEKYYFSNVERELVGASIPATEHSVMCANGVATIEEERKAFERLITEVYPTGLVSIVSDTVDFWRVVDEILPALKDKIMAREGKVVIRPDSGDPVAIMAGTETTKGLIERLWDIFGGTEVAGYKILDPHIGAIYGEAITFERADEICHRLKEKGFCTTNATFGIGSYTYQYNTRDTFGFAYKSTSCQIDGKEIHLFKNPKTDDGTKKSQKGRVRVLEDHRGEIVYTDGHSLINQNMPGNLLRLMFCNGLQFGTEPFETIRARLAGLI